MQDVRHCNQQRGRQAECAVPERRGEESTYIKVTVIKIIEQESDN